MTDWFSVEVGLKQDYILLPALANIKNEGIGVHWRSMHTHSVLLSECEEDRYLQTVFNILNGLV